MRPAGLATSRMLEAVKARIQPGITTLELDRIAADVLRGDGAIANFKLEPGYEHSICVSVNDEIVHGVPGDRVIQAGDLVSVDAGAMLDGWNGDSAFTVVVPGGDPSTAAERQRLSDVTESSMWVGIAELAKAKNLNEVGGAIEDYVLGEGAYGILREYVGHGIGKRMHEEPAVFNYRVRTQGLEVKPGLVICIEPMITGGTEDTFVTEDDWTVVVADDTDGAHWEHTIAVTDGGVWVLTAEDGGAAGLEPFGLEPVPPAGYSE